MDYILSGYLLGVLVGRQCWIDALADARFNFHSSAIILILALGAGVVCHNSVKLKAIGAAVFIITGCFWGLLNSAPAPGGRIEGRVMRTDVSQDGAPALIQTATGRVYEVASTSKAIGFGRVHTMTRPGVFSRRRSTLMITGEEGVPESTRWNELVNSVRQQFSERIGSYGTEMAAWLRSAILGIPDDLGQRLMRAFRRTGLLHIVVVSGSHVTLVAIGALALLATPFRLIYCARLFKPNTWVSVSAVVKVKIIIAVLFFCTLVGASHASQRAVLGFGVMHASRILLGDISIGRRLRLTALIQIVVFPIGFLCESTAMSWLAYLLVAEQAKRLRCGYSFFETLKLQTTLSILMGAICGQWSILGIFANLIIIPIVPWVFGFGLLLLFPEFLSESVLKIAVGVQDKFLEFICWLSELTEGWPFMVVQFGSEYLWFRFLLLILGVIIVLNSWSNLSISREGSVNATSGHSELKHEHGWWIRFIGKNSRHPAS